MKKTITGNSKYLKKINRSLLLDLIRTHKGISRAELARITGLSPTATGVIISDMLKKGYIHEKGIGKSKGGRRPVLFELKPCSYYSVGVDLESENINLTVIDITGKIVSNHNITFNKSMSPGKVQKLITEEILQTLKKTGIKKENVTGIGISIAGIVDVNKHNILLAPNLGWENIVLPKEFKEFENIPVYLENESRCSAIAEHWLGSCRGIDDFVCINIKSGIGSGIFTRGKLYGGSIGSAGEIGHITVCENGPLCGCGNRGCLETVASVDKVIEKASRFCPDIQITSVDDVIEAAGNGNITILNILDESARYLGTAVSYIINILNPSKIILGKDFIKYSDYAINTVKEVVGKKALNIPLPRVKIEVSGIGENSSSIGAAVIPLKVLFGK